MITLTAHCSCNPKYTPGAKKPYIARITGRDSKMTFVREFIGGESADVDSPGLYECRGVDKKGRAEEPDYVLLLDCPTFPGASGDTVRSFAAAKDQAMKIAKALDDGRSIDAICACVDASAQKRSERTWEILSRRTAETKQIADGIDAATEACWQILGRLAEKDAKKVIAALRARVSPPKASATVQQLAASDAPAGVVADAAMDAGVSAGVMGMEPTPVA